MKVVTYRNEGHVRIYSILIIIYKKYKIYGGGKCVLASIIENAK
jgi:hypothetical protein